MRGGNHGAAVFSVLTIIAAMMISIYYYLYPTNSAGKDIAFWCMLVFGTTLFSVVFFQLFGKYIDDD